MKILALDIETSAILGHVWQMYDANVVHVERDWELLSFAYKWLDDKEVVCVTREGEKTDKFLTKKLWKIMNEAEAILAHNGDAFDIKKANAKFLQYKLPPPTPAQSIDTLKIARTKFKLTSNKLDDVAKLLGIGRKVKHPGFALWLGCLADNPNSWLLMEKYNMHDVTLLEQVYLRLRPWAKKHPNVATRGLSHCPKCNSSKLQKRGVDFNGANAYQRLRCMNCGNWCRSTVPEKTVAKRKIV